MILLSHKLSAALLPWPLGTPILPESPVLSSPGHCHLQPHCQKPTVHPRPCAFLGDPMTQGAICRWLLVFL